MRRTIPYLQYELSNDKNEAALHVIAHTTFNIFVYFSVFFSFFFTFVIARVVFKWIVPQSLNFLSFVIAKEFPYFNRNYKQTSLHQW